MCNISSYYTTVYSFNIVVKMLFILQLATLYLHSKGSFALLFSLRETIIAIREATKYAMYKWPYTLTGA